MAKKIFRIHKSGKTSDSGWFDSGAITSEELKSIITDGKGISTSIPSPFARIDLVKSAFLWVANNGIKGKTAQHKLVSDALDIGHLFFLSRLNSNLKVIEYSPNKRFEYLETGVHKEFIETLRTYWEQDGKVYNFNKVERLFFILYNNQLIGGTSPSTLFFAATDVSAKSLNMNIQRGSDVLLDKKYMSLGEREWSYIEYIFALSKTKAFKRSFTTQGHTEFYDYLEAVKKDLKAEQRKKIDDLTDQSINKYDRCHVTNSENNYCDILDIPLGLIKQDTGTITENSDFVIDSEICDEKPLILPYDMFSEGLIYTRKDVIWNGQDMRGKVPYKNEKSKEDSKLPVQKDHYYWLTIGNFLEDKIVQLPYDIDTSKFETGGAKKHLLPLTSTFFKYFKVSDVPKLIKVTELTAKGVKIKLSIPIKGGRKITFDKLYNTTEKLELHIAVFPFIKVKIFPLKYNVGIIDGDIENNNQNVIATTFFNKGKVINGSNHIQRSPGGDRIKSSYVSTNTYFDCIHLTFNELSCFIVPKMPEYRPGSSSYNFAIDFGTTNTHIEYRKEEESLQAFKNERPKTIWASLLDKNATGIRLYIANEATFEQEIIPHTIGDEEISFPLRTALVENNDIDYTEKRELFKHLNNFFLYEKEVAQTHLELTTALKWSNYSNPEDRKRVESYIEYLLTIVFYKTLLSNGKLENIKITWFYPISMTKFQQGVLEDVWEKCYKKVFGENADINKLNKIPESIAPFFYYHNKRAVLGLSVSIDVGGGSSDVSIFDEGEVKTISSFRFAGDSIYGDGYGGSPNVNGFVQKFKPIATNYLTGPDQSDKILNNILESRENSSDFSSYLFSLEKGSGGLFDYSALIKQEMNLKLSILVFYAAIGFYVSKLMKGEGYAIPRNFLFSGSGAKSLSIIDSSADLSHISDMMKYIAERVIGEKSQGDVVSYLSDRPKEITCQGGLLKSTDKEANMIFWLGGSDNSNWDRIADKVSVEDVPKYSDCSDESLNYIIKSIEEFYGILDDFFEKINIDNVFGIKRNAYDVFTAMRTDQLLDFIKKGIELKVISEGGKSNIPIEESLFFYPLVGVLNKLAFKLSQVT